MYSEVGLLIQQHSYDKARIRLLANPEYAKTDQGIRRQIQALGGLGRLADAEAILSENPTFAASVYGQETIGELRMLQGRYSDAADAFDKQYRSRTFAKAILGSKALAMWRGKIPGSLDVAIESCDDSGHYNARGFFVIAMHSPPKSPERLKTLQRAMEYAPDDFIINAYLTEARRQNNVSAELDTFEAAVDASYYPGASQKSIHQCLENPSHHGQGSDSRRKVCQRIQAHTLTCPALQCSYGSKHRVPHRPHPRARPTGTGGPCP